MKNIWLINNYSYPPGTSNWRRHYDLCKELVKENYSVNVICGSFVHDRKNQILEKNEKLRVEKHSGINYHILKGMSYEGSLKRIISMVEFMTKVFFYSKKITNKPDIIYCSCPHPFNGLISLYLSKKYKVPFILEIRDLWPDTWVEMGAMTKRNPIYKIFEYIEKLLYKKADKIIGLMPGIEVFKEKGVKEDKAIWISNGIDLDKFDIDSKKEPKYKFDKNKFNFLYTGSIGIANALDIVMEIANKLKENDKIQFNFIGEGPLKQKYLEYIKENGLKNIKFYDGVAKEEIPAILKEADCLFVSTRKCNLYRYGISFNKVFEYLAASKPIIISYDTKFDIIKQANVGISVPAENEKELYDSFLKMQSISEIEREKYGKNGRNYAKINYDTKVLAIKLKKIIDELIRKNGE